MSNEGDDRSKIARNLMVCTFIFNRIVIEGRWVVGRWVVDRSWVDGLWVDGLWVHGIKEV